MNSTRLFEYVRHPHVKARRAQGPVTTDSVRTSLNARLAKRGTLVFGSMWAFYVFVVYGALGAVFTKQQATLLYWSNWIQLWSLPLLMVGGIVLGKAADQRAQQTYADAEAVLHEAEQIQAHLQVQDDRLAAQDAVLTQQTATLQAIAEHLTGPATP